MKNLLLASEKAIEKVETNYIRQHIKWLDQPERLIGIKGSRGVGKTTLLLQYAKQKLPVKNTVYISLEDLYFSENSFYDFAVAFVQEGGKYLLVDEVHHYSRWSTEMKKIYDTLPELRVIYTGSSLLHLSMGRTDLSRRSVNYTLPGLSFREFINLTNNHKFPALSLQEILKDHKQHAKEVWKDIKPIEHFKKYLKTGYYPFFLEGENNYHKKLNEIIIQILESDLPFSAGIRYANIQKIKQILYIISESVPFKPNIEKISSRVGISRNTLKEYLYYLHEALLTMNLGSESKGISKLSKPEKVYLHNPNIINALAGEDADKGNLRETFFYNQISNNHYVTSASKGDFLIDRKYLFEIGGRNKTQKQIAGIPNSYLALDDIESGYKNEIPLWLFGFLY